ncbi:5-deoxy-glucuronate isomerase [Sorangium sp. So ce367]|uniref:5-deoxy-glucuronate isomerase n=1 Tax=Sorangium sp. So ce367 TaxID=3133305 RepID=UPI003F63E42E
MKPVNPGQVVVRATASHRGRRLSVTPADSPMKRLHYGRILLDGTTPEARFETSGREVGLLCMAGECAVKVNGGEVIALGRYDALYVPRGSTVEVRTSSSVDLVECGAEVEGDYPLQVVRYKDVEQNPSLKFKAGGDATTRELSVLLGKNVQAGRIVAGFTRSAPGHWTSWPPHEHTDLLEEMYVYFDMPPPAFGVQLVYTAPEAPEVVTVVRDGDAVLMPAGYHPNVAAPGHSINFVWLMAAHREREDRVFGVVNVQPEFAQRGSGLEASLK